MRKETGEPDKTVPEVDAQVRVPTEAAANQECMPTQVNDAGKVGPEEDAQVQVQVQKNTEGQYESNYYHWRFELLFLQHCHCFACKLAGLC